MIFDLIADLGYLINLKHSLRFLRLLRSRETSETYVNCLVSLLSSRDDWEFKEISFVICLSSGCTQTVFLILAVSLLKDTHTHTHTHTLPQGKIREQTCRKLVLRFYLVGILIVASYLFSVWPLCSQRLTEWMKGKDKNEEMYKGWKKTLLPQWIEKQRTHTLTHTGLWSDLAFYSLVTQTERKTESVSGSTKTFCVINKAEKRDSGWIH